MNTRTKPPASKPAPVATAPRWTDKIVRIKPRPEGLIFFALGVLVACAAYNTGANLLYLVLAMLIALALISGWLGGRNLRGLRAVWEGGPREVTEGAAGRLLLTLENSKHRAASASLVINAKTLGPRGARGNAAGHCWSVPAGQGCAVRLAFQPERRGWHAIETLTLMSSHPLGFMERSARLRAPLKFLALPRSLSVPQLRGHIKGFEGDLERGSQGHGAAIAGIRDHRPDDPAHLIHWKHSARGLGVKIKEFEDETALRCCVALDLRGPLRPDPAWEAALEHGIRVAAGCAEMLLKQGFLVALWTTGGAVAPGQGRGHGAAILRKLAELEIQPPDALPAPPDFDARAWPALMIEYVDAAARDATGGLPMRRYFPGLNWQVFDARQVGDGLAEGRNLA